MRSKNRQQLEKENHRLRAQIDRLANSPLTLTVGPIEIDRLAHTVCFADVGSDLCLEPLSFKLIELLALRKGSLVSIAEIEQALWPCKPPPVGAVSVQVHRLRNSLGAAGPLIETVRGQGYRLREEIPS